MSVSLPMNAQQSGVRFLPPACSAVKQKQNPSALCLQTNNTEQRDFFYKIKPIRILCRWGFLQPPKDSILPLPCRKDKGEKALLFVDSLGGKMGA